jgi:hypothetical protein
MDGIDGRSRERTACVTDDVDKHVTLGVGVRTDQDAVIKARYFYILNQVIRRIKIDRSGTIVVLEHATQPTNPTSAGQPVKIYAHRGGQTCDGSIETDVRVRSRPVSTALDGQSCAENLIKPYVINKGVALRVLVQDSSR